VLTTIVAFIIFLGILIFVHELGHFITARRNDVRVEEFALGFGPKLISRKKGETVFSIRAIPLGGFCNMVGEMPYDDEELDQDELKKIRKTEEEGRAFYQKTPWQRLKILFMGSGMNFLLAVVAFVLMFGIYGIPTAVQDQAILGEMWPNQPAAQSGLLPGDEVVAIDDREIETWDDMTAIIRENPGEALTFTVLRNDTTRDIEVTPEMDDDMGYAVIGVMPGVVRERVNPIRAVIRGVTYTFEAIAITVVGFAQLIAQRTTEGLGGPVMIASFVGQAARSGMEHMLNLLAIISINLAIINLLPIPALDGGRIVFVLIEIIRGKPIPQEKEGLVHLIGFILLMLLMVFIIYQDIIVSFF